jgi:hypothetical protein
MAKFRPPGSRKAAASSNARSKFGFVPCLVVVVLGLVIVFALLYALLTSGK